MKFFSFLFKKNWNSSHDSSFSESSHAKKLQMLEEANKLFYEEKRDEEALLLYDKVIMSGVFEGYIHRAFCLQSLKYHFEAIEDFDKGIQSEPQNANNFFGRGNSKSAIGDIQGQITDLKRAIELSSVKSEQNDINNIGARAQGFETAKALYESILGFVITKFEMMNKNEYVKNRFLEKLELKRRN